MKFGRIAAVAALTLSLGVLGCKSSQDEDVKTSKLQQWTTVNADTATTTAAVERVLNNEGMMDVKARSTNVDGQVTAKKADGTKVTVDIRRKSQTPPTSEVTAQIGTFGDSKLGAQIVSETKAQLTGMNTSDNMRDNNRGTTGGNTGSSTGSGMGGTGGTNTGGGMGGTGTNSGGGMGGSTGGTTGGNNAQ